MVVLSPFFVHQLRINSVRTCRNLLPIPASLSRTRGGRPWHGKWWDGEEFDLNRKQLRKFTRPNQHSETNKQALCSQGQMCCATAVQCPVALRVQSYPSIWTDWSRSIQYSQSTLIQLEKWAESSEIWFGFAWLFAVARKMSRIQRDLRRKGNIASLLASNAVLRAGGGTRGPSPWGSTWLCFQDRWPMRRRPRIWEPST
jgi:hypothetical protein